MSDNSKVVDNIMQGVDLLDYPMLKKAVEQEGGLSLDEIKRHAINTHYVSPFYHEYKLLEDYFKYRPLKLNDKFKHAVMNCNAAQRGMKGVFRANNLSLLKEKRDVLLGINTLDESNADMDANLTGRYLGIKYPDEDCNELVERYIKR